MKCAIILPIDLLDLANMSDYHLMLPHLFDNEAYRRFYTQAEGFKILDNGVAEGYLADVQELHDLGLALGADEIVVHDKLGDCMGTIDLVRDFEHKARPNDFQYMGVAQGTTIAELVKCINYLSHCEWITTLALPRIINTIHRTQRFNLCEAIWKEYGDKFPGGLHCLGASDWVREVVAIAGTGVVRGMDTSLPAVMGLAGRSLRHDGYVSRGPGFFEAEVDRNSIEWKVVYDNVRCYLDWAGALSEAPEAPAS